MWLNSQGLDVSRHCGTIRSTAARKGTKQSCSANHEVCAGWAAVPPLSFWPAVPGQDRYVLRSEIEGDVGYLYVAGGVLDAQYSEFDTLHAPQARTC